MKKSEFIKYMNRIFNPIYGIIALSIPIGLYLGVLTISNLKQMCVYNPIIHPINFLISCYLGGFLGWHIFKRFFMPRKT